MAERRLVIVTDMGEIEIDPIFWPNINWRNPRLAWRQTHHINV